MGVGGAHAGLSRAARQGLKALCPAGEAVPEALTGEVPVFPAGARREQNPVYIVIIMIGFYCLNIKLKWFPYTHQLLKCNYPLQGNTHAK